MARRWVLLAVVYLFHLQDTAQHHRKGLFPSAWRVKRGTYSLINPTFQHTQAEANLLFEMLLAGMQIGGEGEALLVPDQELASLSRIKNLEVICEDVLPKKLSDVRRLTAELSRRPRPLSWQDFERTLLTLVYAAQTLAGSSSQQQRQMWSDSLLQLFQALQRELRPS